MSYATNKQNAKHFNKGESMTDQSAAHETDRNVIVKRYLQTGQAPGGKAPMYGDFANLPQDLRGYIHTARDLNRLKSKLPKELQGKSLEELAALTMDELTAIHTPPEPPAKPKERANEDHRHTRQDAGLLPAADDRGEPNESARRDRTDDQPRRERT